MYKPIKIIKEHDKICHSQQNFRLLNLVKNQAVRFHLTDPSNKIRVDLNKYIISSSLDDNII